MGNPIRVVEVGPRDGLQNESKFVPTELKERYIDSLLGAGVVHLELTSFVSPKWVPQLADAQQICERTLPKKGEFYALVPNEKGLDRAIEAHISRIALFTAASDSFCRKNINMSREDSVAGFERIIERFGDPAKPERFVRAYISTAFECPYEGKIKPKALVELARDLFRIGVDEISLGDTIGTAGPTEVGVLLSALRAEFDISRIALHFHDTNGTAIANVAQGLGDGVRIFDASAGGLGGCPYAPGAGGNLATEDLVYFLDREGWETGIKLQNLAEASLEVLSFLGRAPVAKAQLAALSRASATPCAT